MSQWQSARMFPETYPGTCPPGHYLLLDGAVLEVSSGRDGFDVIVDGKPRSLDLFLMELGLPPLAERYPVLAYGANRNPASLESKLLNHGYAGPHRCIPVLAATLADAEVVACRLFGQGYFFGEILLDSPFSAGVELEVRVDLVDREALRVLNDSEGILEGRYTAAVVPGVEVTGVAESRLSMGYVANSDVFSSPLLGTPLAFSSIGARSRRIPAMTAREILSHALDRLGLRQAVSELTGLRPDASLAQELSKYLNGQWWYQFNTGDEPLAGYTEVLRLFAEAVAGSSLGSRTLDRLEAQGRLLTANVAYDPDPSLLWGRA
jgi:hypothetical protein